MKNIKQQYEKWYYIAPFALIWLGLIEAKGITDVISKETIQIIPEAVTYSVLLSAIFSKFAWRWSIFRKYVVPFPDLEGTWTGYLYSTWKKNESDPELPPIPVQFCIKQSFETVSIAMFTAESESYSQAALFTEEPDGTQRLKYTYSNTPEATVRDRSEIHNGAANLKIVEKSDLALHGEYWTSRKSTGMIKVKRVSKKLSDCFIDDLDQWLKTKYGS